MSKGQLSLDQLRNRFKQVDAGDDGGNLRQFIIVNQKAEQQILQINLLPAGISFIKGCKLYANSSKARFREMNYHKLDYLKRILRPQEQILMMLNDTTALQIVGLKHHAKNGQILILDLAAYKESIYVGGDFMIASRKEPKKRQKHPWLEGFQMLEYTDRYDNIFEALDINQETVALQSDSVVVEKYLGEEEEFCIYEKEGLMAFSKSVQLQQLPSRMVRATGPGWLFFQTGSNQLSIRRRTTSYLRTIVALSVLLMLLEICLVTFL